MPRPGSLFLFGIEGTKPTRESVALLKDTGASGVLLLARNIATTRQTRDLVRGLQERVGRPLLFCVDHEGGWVLRFRAGLTAFPGNAALGRAKDPALARETGRLMALELAALGIRLNLAPVLDVATADYNPGIGIRSFGADTALVSRLGAAFIRGLQENGVSACAKHFPGKGAATKDAHVELPVIRLPRSAFERRHLAPFAAAVAAGVDCVMTSHVRFPAYDKEIATFSPLLTRAVLRERLGFEGVVISDDLCMGAVTGHLPIQLASVRAISAGHDLLIVAHDPQAQREAAQLLEAAAAEGAVDAADLAAAQRRVADLLAKRRPKTRAPAPAAGARLARRVSEKAAETVTRGALGLPLAPNGRPPLVLVPDFAEVSARFTFEGGPASPERFLKAAVARWGAARFRRVPVESPALGDLAAAVERAPRVLFFCFEALRFPGQRAALELLKRRAPERTAVCLIRSSWDRSLLDPRMAAVDAHGYRLCSLDAALKLLLRPRHP